MRFAERTIFLKDGRTCILKPATPDLAEEMIEYMKKTAIETPFLTRSAIPQTMSGNFLPANWRIRIPR